MWVASSTPPPRHPALPSHTKDPQPSPHSVATPTRAARSPSAQYPQSLRPPTPPCPHPPASRLNSSPAPATPPKIRQPTANPPSPPVTPAKETPPAAPRPSPPGRSTPAPASCAPPTAPDANPAESAGPPARGPSSPAAHARAVPRGSRSHRQSPAARAHPSRHAPPCGSPQSSPARSYASALSYSTRYGISSPLPSHRGQNDTLSMPFPGCPTPVRLLKSIHTQRVLQMPYRECHSLKRIPADRSKPGESRAPHLEEAFLHRLRVP